MGSESATALTLRVLMLPMSEGRAQNYASYPCRSGKDLVRPQVAGSVSSPVPHHAGPDSAHFRHTHTHSSHHGNNRPAILPVLSAQLTSPRSFPCALALRVGFLRKLSSLGDVALAWSGLQNRSGLVGLPDFEFENTLRPQGPKAQL